MAAFLCSIVLTGQAYSILSHSGVMAGEKCKPGEMINALRDHSGRQPVEGLLFSSVLNFDRLFPSLLPQLKKNTSRA